MKFQVFSSAVIAISMATLGTISPALAGPKSVPFKASVITQETLRANLACPSYVGGETTGTGHASHLGAITFIAADCVSPGMTSFTFSNGTLTIYGASGDTLTASYDGVLTPNPQPNSLSSLTGRFRVTGGTGRFSAASGSGYLQGVENLATGHGQFELTGDISY